MRKSEKEVIDENENDIKLRDVWKKKEVRKNLKKVKNKLEKR